MMNNLSSTSQTSEAMTTSELPLSASSQAIESSAKTLASQATMTDLFPAPLFAMLSLAQQQEPSSSSGLKKASECESNTPQ